MSLYTNLSCISDKVNVKIPCENQTGVEYWLDDLGLSLADTAKTADERYITGKNLVAGKIRIALDDVISWLTYNVTKECIDTLDITGGILCDYSSRIAKAVWYKTAALTFKDISFDTSRYNEFIHYGEDKAMAQMIYLDSSFKGLTNTEVVEAGMYQKELEMLVPLRDLVERSCTPECKGTRWQITIP